MSNEKEVYVIGHKNPDTDSICSAIAYAYLKNQAENTDKYVAKRVGSVSSETQFVLDTFAQAAPEYIENVRSQVRDIAVNPGERIDASISVKRAWEILNSKRKSTLVILDDHENLEGLITIGDIAKSIMDVYGGTILADAKTPYSNIIDTIDGELLVDNPARKTASGKVIIATANPDQMEAAIEPGDMVILGDRYESQMCAIEMDAACLIICINSEVNDNILEMAREKGCVVIRTHYDTYITARLLNQSIPVSYFMIRNGLLYFRLDNYIEDIRGVMAKVRHREFPVLDSEGKFAGTINRNSLLQMTKKKVILVDHNESGQAVDGLHEADLEAIIDHHKIGFVETLKPVLFRNQPVGCTATIIYMMFREQGIEIPKEIAGLMCSAIISDTLLYRSPTCTAVDRIVAEELAGIAGIETEKYAKAMFAAGSNLKAKTEKEIFNQDFKKFQTGDFSYGIGQITSMDGAELEAIVDRMYNYMQVARDELDLDMLFFMLTDILEESTLMICVGPDALKSVSDYSGCPVSHEHCVYMQGVVSRKKQTVPIIAQALGNV